MLSFNLCTHAGLPASGACICTQGCGSLCTQRTVCPETENKMLITQWPSTAGTAGRGGQEPHRNCKKLLETKSICQRLHLEGIWQYSNIFSVLLPHSTGFEKYINNEFEHL